MGSNKRSEMLEKRTEAKKDLLVIIENIASSIEKWEEIKRNIINRRSMEYHTEFWEPCGYCKSFTCKRSGGGDCPLHTGRSRKYNMPYCCKYFGNPPNSIASNALLCADKGILLYVGSWKRALDCTNILLAKMKRDRNRYRNRLYDMKNSIYIKEK